MRLVSLNQSKYATFNQNRLEEFTAEGAENAEQQGARCLELVDGLNRIY